MTSPLPPRRRATTVLAAGLACAAVLACTSSPRARALADPRTPRGTAQEPPAAALPEGWESLAPLPFEALVDGLPAGGVRWSAEDLARLAAALDRQDGSSLRAAVLLAHSPVAAATEVLLARLERRVEAPARPLDAGDKVAAAALGPRGQESGVATRLEALAVGPTLHPDLEVRVECACGALAAGRDAVVPFLLRVLRALTPAEADDPPDWERVTTVAWAKHRAAEALAARAATTSRFRPDGSWADQMEEAQRLEGLLQGGR